MRARIIGVAILGAAACVAQAQPNRLTRWPPHAVIAVWLDTRAAPPGADTLVGRAVATWTHAAAGRFVLQPSSSRDAARISVRFVRADGIYGEASPRIDEATGMIGSAEVLIAGDVSGGDAVQQRIVIYLTALHELGHALGLPHTSVFDDIMYSFRRPDDGERYFGAYRRRLRSSDDIGTERATGLSPADVAALQTLYDR
jgi:hypothetical protein